MMIFVFCCTFRECVLPEGLVKALPKLVEVPKDLDLIDCAMVSSISTCNFDATKHPRCIETHPRPVWKGPESRKYGLGTRARTYGLGVA